MTRTPDRLVLSHLWVSFAAMLVAMVLGAWQMWERSPLPAPLAVPAVYYASVTLHGVLMAYVLTTFFAMGFGYAIVESTLGELKGRRLAWLGFWICLLGTTMTGLTILGGRASVLYTFYPPVMAPVWFYLGVILLFGGSWIWAALMGLNMLAWKRSNPGNPVPLSMFAITATAVIWIWTSVGALVETVFILVPFAAGWTATIDVGLARSLFSWTLHGIVYFWLMPAYIALYTLVPRAAGGRLYSDTLPRVTFILFVVFALPVGLHHLFMDPEHGRGFKLLQAILTFMVVVPTLMTVFTVAASLEIAARLRGGRGLVGWVWALPFREPLVLALALTSVMLGLGGYGGLVNMSYGMNAMVHNTQFVTAHFHLIFGGATVVMYFATAYEIWPSLTGCARLDGRLVRLQLWLWAAGILLITVPWHIVGLMGQPRRMSTFDYGSAAMASTGWLVEISVVGGVIALASALLFVVLLGRAHGVRGAATVPIRFAVAVHPAESVPASLNGFGVWNGLLALMMLLTYGWPIAQFFVAGGGRAILYPAGGAP